MSLIAQWAEVVTVSGTGSSVVDATVYASPARGRVRGIIIRQDAGGGGTSLTSIWLTHTPATALTGGVPVADYVIAEGSAVALTASATAPSARTRIDTPPEFAKGLGLTVSVVASGAWTLVITLAIEDLNGTGVS